MKSISVILPVYNAGQEVGLTIDSILEQTFKDFELIIINDGSTDNSIDILKEYKKKFPSIIRLIDKNNTGVSDSRNIGLREAKGKYITFIDSDDRYEKIFLEKLYCKVDEGYDLVSCAYSNFGLNNNTIKLDKNISTSDRGIYLKSLQSGFLFNQLWNKIYVKEIIEKNHINFDEKKSIAEDWEFNVKYISKCKNFFFLNQSLYRYNISENGLGFRYRKDAHHIKFHILNLSLKILGANNDVKEYIYESYIKQFFSFFSVIMDRRNDQQFSEKLKVIKDFLRDKEINRVIDDLDVNNKKFKLLLLLLRTKSTLLLSFLGIVANRYDKFIKKEKFGIKGRL